MDAFFNSGPGSTFKEIKEYDNVPQQLNMSWIQTLDQNSTSNTSTHLNTGNAGEPGSVSSTYDDPNHDEIKYDETK